MQRNQIIALFALVVLGIIVWQFSTRNEYSVPVTGVEREQFVNATVVDYVGTDGSNWQIAYVGDLAEIRSGDLVGTILRQVPATTGARYEGGNGLVLTRTTEVITLVDAQKTYVEARVVEPPAVANPVPPSDEIANVATTLTWVRAVQGSTTTVPNNSTAFTLTLNPDGTVRGTTDCNAFSADYTITDTGYVLSNIAATEMFCEDSQESEFFNFIAGPWVRTSTSDDELTVSTLSGATLVFRVTESSATTETVVTEPDTATSSIVESSEAMTQSVVESEITDIESVQ